MFLILINLFLFIFRDTEATTLTTIFGYEVGPTHEAIKLANDAKQVVVFAGPDRSSAEEVELFFHQYANGWTHGNPKSKALRRWFWPSHPNGVESEHVFDLLVTDPSSYNDDTWSMADLVLEHISDRFEESENGIILGSERFDQVGPVAEYDAMSVLTNVLDYIQVPASNVTVILNYKTPRLEQWISIWQNSQGQGQSYQDFMCQSYLDKALRKERMSMIGASMNAMNAAYEFLRKGWNVRLIDLEGVNSHKRGVTHVIGCDILLGECEHGNLYAHEAHATATEVVPDIIDELGKTESQKIEKLFRYRDCGYQDILQPYIDSGKLIIMEQHSVWNDCHASKKAFYTKLADVEKLSYEALLSQVNCSNISDARMVSMDQVLGIGQYVNENGIHYKNEFFHEMMKMILLPLLILFLIVIFSICIQKDKERRKSQLKSAVHQAELTSEMRRMRRSTFSQQSMNLNAFRSNSIGRFERTEHLENLTE